MKHLIIFSLALVLTSASVAIEAKEVIKQKSKIDAKLARIKAKMSVKSKGIRKNKELIGKRSKDGTCNVNVGSQENNGIAVNTQINMVARDVIVICE
ncbi:hypothetical protein Q4493_14855 [Colwellia sp. 1_MG-2023]|uniref:hypothetical protein n=1 Tax=Colwellia sp. 1_MG-2023 TaxID=3062649 RepID=UPI0026E4302C|nr:hypothetical protein [Colwellia sp. 1_MG-2023]MDO6447048.1 hypothetical protein [Colwellia sp. 1_MG-2023]